MVDAREMARVFRAAADGARPEHWMVPMHSYRSEEVSNGRLLASIFDAIAAVYENTAAAEAKTASE